MMAHPRINALGVLLDLDGTVYEAGAAIPGAREAIDAIRRAGRPVRFATNTTRRPRYELVERLRGFRIDVAADDIITAPIAAVTWLAARGIHRVALHIAEATLAEFGDFTFDDDQPEAVVIGDLGSDWTFDRLNRAFRQLQTGAHFVAMQKNRYWQTEGGLTLDAGPFVAALEYATGSRRGPRREAEHRVLRGRGGVNGLAGDRCRRRWRRHQQRCTGRDGRRGPRGPGPNRQVPASRPRCAGPAAGRGDRVGRRPAGLLGLTLSIRHRDACPVRK